MIAISPIQPMNVCSRNELAICLLSAQDSPTQLLLLSSSVKWKLISLFDRRAKTNLLAFPDDEDCGCCSQKYISPNSICPSSFDHSSSPDFRYYNIRYVLCSVASCHWPVLDMDHSDTEEGRRMGCQLYCRLLCSICWPIKVCLVSGACPRGQPLANIDSTGWDANNAIVVVAVVLV